MSLEGGFQGRTNKLVDGCYSFWMGGVFPIIGKMLESLDADNSVLDFVYDRGNQLYSGLKEGSKILKGRRLNFVRMC